MSKMTPDRDQGVSRFVGLARTIAREIAARARLPLDDVYSAALLGVLRAVREHDPAKGVSLPAFVAWKVRWAIKDECRSLDHLSRRLRRDILADDPRRERPTGGDSLQGVAAPTGPFVVEELESARSLLKRLPWMHARIVWDRVVNGDTFREIAASLGVSESHVCHRYHEAMRRLRGTSPQG